MSRQTFLALLKPVLAAAILFVVGRQFYRDLTSDDFQNISFHPGWLVASAILYLSGLATWGLFWFRLMRLFDQNLSLPVAMRAYFLGQLGKYIPGKAWALLIRGDQAAGPGVGMGVSIVTAFYEVLTGMAAGGLLAAVTFFFDPPRIRGLDFPPALTGLALLGLCGIPLMPGVFNLLARRMAQRFPSLDTFQVPRLRLAILLQGIALTSVGWMLMGLSVWACLASVTDPAPSLTPARVAQFTGAVGLAYVLGFAAIVVPGGVGVREWVLRELLASVRPDQPAIIVAAVLLLRLAWTAAEIAIAAAMVLFVRRPPPRPPETASITPPP